MTSMLLSRSSSMTTGSSAWMPATSFQMLAFVLSKQRMSMSVLEQHAGDITLLFTDVQMPGGRDGFDLAREAAERWPDIKILVASGTAKPGPEDLPPNAVFVGKPFSAP